MAWDGNGIFGRLYSWVQDRNNGIKIVSSRHDQEDDNLAAGINACITKNNESKPTADFRPNADASYALGSASLRWVRGFFSSGVRLFNGAINYVDLIPSTLTTVRTVTIPDADGAMATSGANNTFIGDNSFSKRPILLPVGKNSGDGGGVIFRELLAGSAHFIILRAPDSVPSNYSITLPTGQGAPNTVLTNDGNGNCTWSPPSQSSYAKLVADGVITL